VFGTLRVYVSEHSVCSRFIGGTISKYNWDDVFELFIWEKVWLKRGRWTGSVHVRIEIQAAEDKDPQVDACSTYVTERQRFVGVRKWSHGIEEFEL
jgi:hypothetical protein